MSNGLIGTGQAQLSGAIKGLDTAATLEAQREQANRQLEAAQDARTTSMIGSLIGVGAMVALSPFTGGASLAPVLEAGSGLSAGSVMAFA